MSKINLSQNESKVLRALIEDSSKSINQLAEVTNLNRNTVRSAIRSIQSKGVVKNFTVNLSTPDREQFLLIDTNNLDQIPEESREEVLHLSNGKYIVLAGLEAIRNKIEYNSINIVDKREIYSILHNRIKVYCDYCNKELSEDFYKFDYRNHEYYACCSNCKADLMKRLARSD